MYLGEFTKILNWKSCSIEMHTKSQTLLSIGLELSNFTFKLRVTVNEHAKYLTTTTTTTSPQRHLRKARRSSADEKNNKLLVSRSPSKLTVKSRSWLA